MGAAHPNPSAGDGKRSSRTATILAALLMALLLGLGLGLFLGHRSATSARDGPAPARAPAAIQLDGVPDVRQSTGYTCGAAALQAVLAYWGTSEREDRLAARLKTTAERGTDCAEIARVAREFGLQAEVREGLQLEDLVTALARGFTVIVDLQAWREQEVRPWSQEWEEGHYMVLVGRDDENLYFEDPSLLGSRGFIPHGEFVERWHDYEGQPPYDPTDRAFVHMAIFIRGDEPAPPASLVPVQ